jgi:hypothetical protein
MNQIKSDDDDDDEIDLNKTDKTTSRLTSRLEE